MLVPPTSGSPQSLKQLKCPLKSNSANCAWKSFLELPRAQGCWGLQSQAQLPVAVPQPCSSAQPRCGLSQPTARAAACCMSRAFIKHLSVPTKGLQRKAELLARGWRGSVPLALAMAMRPRMPGDVLLVKHIPKEKSIYLKSDFLLESCFSRHFQEALMTIQTTFICNYCKSNKIVKKIDTVMFCVVCFLLVSIR